MSGGHINGLMKRLLKAQCENRKARKLIFFPPSSFFKRKN